MYTKYHANYVQKLFLTTISVHYVIVVRPIVIELFQKIVEWNLQRIEFPYENYFC